MDQIEIMLDNLDRAYERGLITEKQWSEETDRIIEDANRRSNHRVILATTRFGE